ncbi:MAG: NUDIX pyrophosphatase [Thermoplasmatota archaeon]
MPEVCAHFVDVHIFRRRAGTEEWLVMKRADHIRLGGSWQMVSGMIEPGEKAYEAGVRELFEETGLRPVHFYQTSFVNRFYLAATDQIMLTPVFAVEAEPDANVVLSDEHTEFLWVSPEEAQRRYPWPGQRESLRVIREQFIDGTPRPESCLDSLVQTV